jgi:hypothetical protein
MRATVAATARGSEGQDGAWGDNPVSSRRSYSRAKGPGIECERLSCPPVAHYPIWRGPKPGVLDGVRRGPVGPPGTP